MSPYVMIFCNHTSKKRANQICPRPPPVVPPCAKRFVSIYNTGKLQWFQTAAMLITLKQQKKQRKPEKYQKSGLTYSKKCTIL
jgi:hypothetical protein